ncbi:mushroom body large-type kenyon cell-specific protein 1 [Plakobranchus ocellatus]|uniref:Mushroom body large-type kenyon cell-specific protein 1 n=1 Tax=Plakobranchus ocellatus TaxID=259542 RepID=A0AAV4E1Q0_9GAST|nr:mushroom body large-type kenyon cell-specific protein 1 [Plakobranchus ocellatus]
MVDCGSPRCAQGRRSFRRDLQLWGKKLPVVLGLERIAADYVDKETAEQLLNPYPAWEKSMTVDFEPAKKCFHCDKKLPNIYRRIQRIVDEAKRGKVGSGKICLRSLQDLMPFCLDFYKHGFGHELFSDCTKEYFINASTIATEPLQPHVSNSIFDVQLAPPSSSIKTDSSSQKSISSAAKTREGEAGRAKHLVHATTTSPSTSTLSSAPVLVHSDSSLNKLRVPNPISGRSYKKNEWQQQDFERQDSSTKGNEDGLVINHPWHNDSLIKRSGQAHMIYNNSKSQDIYDHCNNYNLRQERSLFSVHLDEHQPCRKRRFPYGSHAHAQVVISDSEEEEEEEEYLYRKHTPYLNKRYMNNCHQLQEMSALELFESAHRRLRLEHLEQLGQLGRLDHEQQQQMDGLCSAASASLFRLANQHLLPPGLEQSALSAAAAAAAAVTPASPALPFLLPILPCSLKLKLEPEQERGLKKRYMEESGDQYCKDDDLTISPMHGRDTHLSQRGYHEHNSHSFSDHVVTDHSKDRYEILQQQYRLEQLRRMHNLNGVVKETETQDRGFDNLQNPWSTRPPVSAHDDCDRHDFYHKELKLPLLTDLVRKLVSQKFEEITRRTRQSNRCATPREKSPEVSHTHLQQLLLQQRSDESFVPFNQYLSPMASHFLPSAMGSEDEKITVPMYKHIMESIYNNMMKEESAPSAPPTPFGKVNDSGLVGEALKDIITKSISEKIQFKDPSMPDNNIAFTAVSEPAVACQTTASSNKPQIWSPALSAVHQNADKTETSSKSKNNEDDNDMVSPPPKRSKKDGSSNLSRNKCVINRRTSAQSTSVDASSKNSEGNGKKTRPKRGQYRKYNSQLLMDAVKAVQRGEMSVHRAGSFYGVPHSTLEYKVKERHLLRQKKPREAGGSPDSKTASEASSPPPSASSISPRLSIRTPSKALRTGRTRSQDSSSSFDGDSSVSGGTAGPLSSNKRPARKTFANDSSSPRSSVSSSTPPSPVPTPLPPASVSMPNSKPSVSCSTSPPSHPLGQSPAKSFTPLPLSSPSTVTNNKEKVSTSNSLSNNFAWFQPYLDSSPSVKQLLEAEASSSSPSPSSLQLDSLAHTNSASELLRKLQHKVQAKGGGISLKPGSPDRDGGGGAFELPCGQDRGVFEFHRHGLQHGAAGTAASLQDRLMFYKQSV